MEGFKSIHRKLIIDALNAEDMRLHNRQFSLNIGGGEDYLAINAYIEYYEEFFKWLISGSTEQGSFIILSEKARKYKLEYKGRNVAYGPRIAEQLDYVVERLKKRPSTKRATIQILEKGDSIVNEADFTIEYPCTWGYNFYVKSGKLCMTTIMRSNNIVSVIGLDVFLSVNLLKKVSELTGIEVGMYNHFMVDAHIIQSEIERAKTYIALEI